MSNQPSLLVFTLAPARECARRKLLPRSLDHLANGLLERTITGLLNAGRAAGCRLEVSAPQGLGLPPDVEAFEQQGASFGERFRSALRATQSRTQGPTIIVGSDIPGLGHRQLEQALAALESAPDSVVVGPSPDGGFYLLATRRPLDRELAEVRWCSRRTLRSLRRALRRSGVDVVLLEPLRDLDRAQDLSTWIAREAGDAFRRSRLGRLLWSLLSDLRRPARPLRLGRPVRPVPLALAVRGPPAD